MRKLGIIIIGLMCLATSLFAQDPSFRVDGTILNGIGQKPEVGVRVYVQQEGKSIGEVTTQANGKYDLKVQVDYAKPFELHFKKDNFFAKRIVFDYTKLNPEDDLPAGDVRPWSNANIEIVSKSSGAQLGFLESEPVAKFGNGVSPVPDNSYNDKMKAKVKAVMDGLANQENAKELAYQKVIKEADELYLVQKKYTEALAKYEAASALMPAEAYPIKRIDELDALIKAEKEANLNNLQADSEYYNLIKAGDALRDQKSYPQAITKYKEALQKKKEQYPQDEINKLEKIIEEQNKEAEIQMKYNEAVKLADMFYNQKSFETAREKYLVANKLKPNEAHPTTRLADLDKKIADLEAKKATKRKYDDLITQADELFTQEKWADSKSKYQEALSIESASSYPTDRIKLCDEKILELQKEKDRLDKIATLLKDGALLVESSKWIEAKVKYTEVIQLDNTNAEAVAKLSLIEEKIKAQEADAAKEAKWAKLVQEAETAVKLSQWNIARAKFVEAIGLKPTKEIQDKLDSVLVKIKEEEDRLAADSKFQELKKKGLDLMVEKKWQEAKVAFTEAKSIKDDQVVNVKLAEVEKYIQQQSAAEKLEEDYQTAITSAQSKELSGELEQAITFYKLAESKKPLEKLPKDKIKELELLKIEKAKQQEVDKKYAELMKKGDQWMAEKNYVAAIREFNQALTLKPTEKEPVDKAAEAERLEKEKNSETDQLFNKMIEASEKELEQNNFAKAREYAERALKNRPDESKPKELITRIAKLEKEQKDYESKMADAKIQLDAQKLELAKSLYQQASSIKPNEKAPKEQIEIIDRLIAEKQSEIQKNEQYKLAMSKAFEQVKKLNYAGALAFFQSALSAKPGDQTAKDKIDEIQQIIDNEQNRLKADEQKKSELAKWLVEGDDAFSAARYEDALSAYEKALKLDPASQLIKQKVESSKAKLNDLKTANETKEYNELIKKADDFFRLKNYGEARTSYEKARDQKPADNYPKRKLDEIDAILNSQSTAKLLPDLGTPVQNSSLDGYALLVKADLERKNAQSGAIDSKVNSVNKVIEQNDRINGFSIQTTDNYLSQVDDNAGETIKASEQKNRRTIDYLEEVAAELAKEAANSNANQDEQTRNAVAKIAAIDQQVNSAEKDNTDLYNSNTEVIKTIELGTQKASLALLKSDAVQSVGMNESLQSFESRQQKNASIAYNEAVRNDRQLTQQVEGTLTYQNQQVLNTDRSINEKQEVITSVVLKSQNDNPSDRNLQLTNDTRIRAIQQSVIKGQENTRTNEDKSMQQTGSQIEGIRNQAADILQREQEQGLVTNTIVDKKTQQLVKAEQNQFVKDQSNGIDQGQRVMKVDDNINREMVRQSTNTIDNSAKINRLETKLETAETALLNSEKDESMTVEAKVNKFVNGQSNQQVQLTSQERSMKRDYLDVAAKATNVQANTDRELAEKSYEHGVKIDTRLNATKVKTRTPNEIGLNYPEGVSEENFTRSDSFGYVTAYITRRVVVVEGQGDVYVRTQTLDNTTYSKNGKPITEEAWIQHTQNSDLVKNTKN
jgi:tetratricopeptide (TPR) repeat protein